MYQYRIKLTLKSEDVINCVALDTQLNAERVECIKVKVGDVDCLIELDALAELEVCINNPPFEKVVFS